MSDGGEDEKWWKEIIEKGKRKGLSALGREQRQSLDFDSTAEALGFAGDTLEDYHNKFAVEENRRLDLEDELAEEIAPVTDTIRQDVESRQGDLDEELIWEDHLRTDENVPRDSNQGFDFTGETFLGYLRSGTRRIGDLDDDIEGYSEKLEDIEEDILEHEEKAEELESDREDRLSSINDSDYERHEDARRISNKRNRAEQRREREEMGKKMEGDQGEQYIDLLDKLHEAEDDREVILEAQERAYGDFTDEALNTASRIESELNEVISDFEDYMDFGEQLEEEDLSSVTPLGVDSGIPELKRLVNQATNAYATVAGQLATELESVHEQVERVEEAVYEEVNDDVASDIEEQMADLAGEHDSLEDRVDYMFESAVDLNLADAIVDEGVRLQEMRDAYNSGELDEYSVELEVSEE